MSEALKNNPIEKIQVDLKETEWYRKTIENPDFRKWFAGSKVTYPDGTPMPVFHITPSSFNEFDIRRSDLGIHFGSLEAVHERALEIVRNNEVYDGWRIIPAFLKITNPLETEDLLFFCSPQALEYLRRKSSSRKMDFFNDWIRKKLKIKDSYSLKSMASVRSLLRNRNFDGLKYQNGYEGVGTTSFMVLDESQIWHALSQHIGEKDRESSVRLESPEDMRFEEIEELNKLVK